ncbi:ABC transporter substrate-binding protein [candidate division KSB1 bacterium]|nr:ABC transporter substrate-binding protein [candidate division KSB1 bacterium]
MTSIKRLWLIIVASSLPTIVAGQAVNPEELFTQGLILYRNENYSQAKLNFLKLSALREDNPRETIGIMMLAKTHYQLREYDDAIHFADRLINDYPMSSYVPHAYYLRATAHYQKRNYDQALDNFSYAIEFAKTAELRHLAESTATSMIDRFVSLRKIDNLAAAYPWEQAKPIITLWRARLEYKSDQSAAKRTLENFLATRPAPRYASIAEQLMNKDFGGQQVRIGLLQPVSGYFAEEAQDFLRGCAFALKKRTGGPEIALILKDTRSDIVTAISAAYELADTDVQLVVSDLEGMRSATIAGLLRSSGIPVIIPVSTDNDLTRISDAVFQLNSDLDTRGAALAEYAIKELRMKTFATLAPADDYGNTITDAFANKVDELHGAIVSQQWYYPGTTDFSGHLQAIREAGFRYAYRDSLRSWGLDANRTRVDSIYTRLDRRARRRSEDNEKLAAYTDISVRSIDGFFVPCNEEDIPFIASQFALYNIKSQLLGGESWNNAELLRRQQRYVNGAVYVAGFYLSETDLDYINFTRDFRLATATSPGVMALYGYNMMNLIIQAVDAGNLTARDIAAYLNSVREFDGLGTKISLHNRQVNDRVNILRFQDGIIYRVNE